MVQWFAMKRKRHYVGKVVLDLVLVGATWAMAVATPARAERAGVSCPTAAGEESGKETGRQVPTASRTEEAMPAPIDAARPVRTEVAVFALG